MMTRNAIILISLFAIAATYFAKSEEHVKYSILSVEYIGISNKPITPIVISDSKVGAEWYVSTILKRSELELTYVHVLNISLLEKLIEEAKLYKSKVLQEQKKSSQSHKIISLTIITAQKKNTYLYDTESAISLLDNLRRLCKSNESLHSDLSHFQNRILSLSSPRR
jgi:hypothetical protein